MQNETPTVEPVGMVDAMLSGENETVRPALLAALMEAMLRFLDTLRPDMDKAGTRRLPANGYRVKDAAKAGDMRAVAGLVGLKVKAKDAADMVNRLMAAGVYRLHFTTTRGIPWVINTADSVMMDALAATNAAGQAVRRAAAAIVAFDQWQGQAAAEREAAIRALKERTGQDVDEVPEGCKVATAEQAAAFGLAPGDLIRYVVVESVGMLRDAFVHLRGEMEKHDRSMLEQSDKTTTQGNGYNCSVLDVDAGVFTVNRASFVEWFKSSVFAGNWYCSPCKQAKRTATYGNAQVKNAGHACPTCGTARHLLKPGANFAHLPMLTSKDDGLSTSEFRRTERIGEAPTGTVLKVIGGHRFEMRAFRFTGPAFNAGVKATRTVPTMTVEDAMRAMMKPGAVKVRGDRGTFNRPARLVPVLFDIQADGGFSHHLGWAVEALHEGEVMG